MAIDPRIPLMGQGLERRPGPMDYYAKAAQLQSLAQQNRLADLQMQQAQRAIEEDAALRQAVAQAGGDWGAIEKTLLGRGMIGPAMKIGEFNAKRTKEGAEAEKEKRLATRMRIEDGARLLFSAKDQDTYARARATAIQREIAKPDEWPEQFDPNFVSQQVQEAQTVKDLIDQGKPMTEIGKLLEDMRKGKVPQGIGQAAITKATTHPAPSSSVVNLVQEREESKAVGKGYGEQYIDVQKAGLDAGGKVARYERLEQLLEGVETGKLTPAMTQIAAVADSLGLKIDPNLPAKQAIEALSNEVALQLRNPSGGAGMPGALSDKDREFLVGMSPGLSKTPGGNKLIIQTAKKLAQRDRDVSRIAREYRKKRGQIDEGFYDELATFSAANPLFQGGKSAPAKPGWKIEEVK